MGAASHPTQFEVSQVPAEKFGITREDMDASRWRATAGRENTESGWFAEECVPVPLKDEDGNLTGEVIDRIRHPPREHPWRAWARCRAP